MASSVQPALGEQTDLRTILGGGIKLGLVTVAGVVVFALLSRVMAGRVEVIAQAALLLAGGAVFSYFPASQVRPRSVDAIAWAAMIGLLGALTFTVIDTAVLRPVKLYHWTWDAIGGGSGFWYIPVWWMGSAFLAWLGATIVGYRGRGDVPVNVPAVALQTVVIALVLFIALAATGVAPLHASIAGLSFALALVFHTFLSAASHRR
jgi:hypothetical protein